MTLNLVPAGVRRGGAALDLAMAVDLLAAAGALEPLVVTGCGFTGELGLDGPLRPVKGVVALAGRTIAERDEGHAQDGADHVAAALELRAGRTLLTGERR